MILVYQESVDILNFISNVSVIHDLSEINENSSVVVIYKDEVYARKGLEKFFSWISNGGSVIWIGNPFRRIYTENLSSAKEIKEVLLQKIPGVKKVYIGYNLEKGYFVELEYKFKNESDICSTTKIATLFGIIPENAGYGLPLSGNVVPFNICSSREEYYTTSYSILIGRGQIIKPFISLSTTNKFLLLGLILRLVRESFKDVIQVEKDLVKSLNNLVLDYSQAVSLYIMGYYSSSAVTLRKIVEGIILNRYLDKICDYVNKNNVSLRKNECKKTLCDDKKYYYGLIYNFTCLLEGLIELVINNKTLYSNLKGSIEFLRNIGNIGAHGDVNPSFVASAIAILPNLIRNLDYLVNELINESNNPNRITNKSL